MKKYLAIVGLLGLLAPSGAAFAQTAQNDIIYQAMLNQVIQLQLKLLGMLRGLHPSAVPTSLDLTSSGQPATRAAAAAGWEWKHFADQGLFLNVPTDWDEELEKLGDDIEGDEPTVRFSNNPGVSGARVSYENCDRDSRGVEAERLTVGSRAYCAVEVTEDDDETTVYRKHYITRVDGDHVMISFEVMFNEDDNDQDDVIDEAEELFDQIITSASYAPVR